MAKKAYVRNSENTAWVELASSVPDLSAYQPKVANVSDTEIGYLDGVTSNIQLQIDSKLDTTIASNTYATISYTDTAVTTAVSNVIDASPTTLDTLNELAAALGDDPNFATTITNLVAEKMANVPGMISQYAGATSPNGWLICDGSAVSRTTYSSLFTAIGTTYGTGNGSTTFNLPNLKGRVVVGVDAAQTEFDALGETGGAKTHTLTVAEMPSHTHVQDAHTHTQNAHTHVQDAHTHIQDAHNHPPYGTDLGIVHTQGTVIAQSSGGAAYSPAYNRPTTGSRTATNQNTTATNQNTTATNQNTTATNQNTGGGGAHNNLQPYIAMNYIIKY